MQPLLSIPPSNPSNQQRKKQLRHIPRHPHSEDVVRREGEYGVA
jgi:hypothetical protein